MRVIVVLFIALLGWKIDIAAADDVPKLNVVPSCEAAAQGAVVQGRNKEACLEDERGAREQIAKNWSQFSPADKQQCVSLVARGGPPSYVELISCLEAMRDARSLSNSDIDRPLLENGKLDVRKMDATVFSDLESGRVTKARAKKGVTSQTR